MDTEDKARKLKKLADCLRIIADLTDSAEPLHQSQLLIEVARAMVRDEKLEVSAIAERLGISTSASSRNVAALGDWHRLQKTGYQLVTTKLDPSDRRRKSVVLTRKGETVINQLMEKL